MVNNHKKSISWRFIFALLFSVAIMALLFFTLPISIVNPSGLGAYTIGGSDSATGMGTDIPSSNNWFMYNNYTGGTQTFDIQAGNPKGGENFIGTYEVTDIGGGKYTVIPTFFAGITVTDEHLAISDSPNFTGNPSQDEIQQDFGVPFSADGSFYIFAHWSVEY